MIARILGTASPGTESADRLVQNLPKWCVIGTISEGRRGDRQVLRRHVRHEELLNGFRAGRGFHPKRTSIAIEDAEVASGNHVEVDICEDIVGFGWR